MGSFDNYLLGWALRASAMEKVAVVMRWNAVLLLCELRWKKVACWGCLLELSPLRCELKLDSLTFWF